MGNARPTAITANQPFSFLGLFRLSDRLRLPLPAPPREQATACEDQTGESAANDGSGDPHRAIALTKPSENGGCGSMGAVGSSVPEVVWNARLAPLV
jgi:hypothetical protein